MGFTNSAQLQPQVEINQKDVCEIQNGVQATKNLSADILLWECPLSVMRTLLPKGPE